MRRSALSVVGGSAFVPIKSLLERDCVCEAFSFIDSSSERFDAEIIRICEIPAPPFKEQQRGLYLVSRFTELGLSDVHTDSEGNVIGFYRGDSATPLIVLSAHLDTVFPEGTDVRVRRESGRFLAPGIADNCSGLAALVALIQALNSGAIAIRGTLAFVGTVGEEGEGDLRGVRHLFHEGRLAGRVSAFISFDGPGTNFITHQALGSRRYRVRLEGPGGHSWADFGVVNPVHALGRAAARLAGYHAPIEPRTTYNIGRIAGGESVNVIPERAEMDVDLRSVSASELTKLEDFLVKAVHSSIAEENALRAASGLGLRLNVALIGNRPSGETSAGSTLVRTALAASRALGIEAVLNRASTDANIPISLGIPSITIGTGGSFGDSHRLSEWYAPEGRDLGHKRALMIALAMAGVVSP